jgi:acetyltransferase-like isoleucine patch superfamily enzyme/glycosyltransferase involved in cell wall biosynthesis
MATSEIILSICIPTCNRAETLRRTLQSITEQVGWSSGQVEVVVSDNCSTDHTESVVAGFIARYPDRIRYAQSPANDADGNFERVLRMGRGDFLKLHSDNFGIHDGLLGPLLRILASLRDSQPVVFFLNQEAQEGQEVLHRLHGMDAFMDMVSFNCTWIGGFGIWREEFESMTDFSRAQAKKLVQTDVLLRLLAHRQESVVIREFMFPAFGSGRKGGYNVAEVFGANYLSILAEQVDSGHLSSKAYARAKHHVLVDQILPFALDPNHDFLSDNLEHHLRDYASEPYFRPALERALQKAQRGSSVLVQQPRSQPTAQPLTYEHAWRRANAHNETQPGVVIPLSKVSIGRRTYGTVNAWHWGHEDETLRIGHFCSIGAGVEFMLGGNHQMQGFSTFPFKVKMFGHEREAISRGPIVVGDDVWIGNRVMVMSGVTIGQGAVIGAGAVVTRDVPPYAVVAGNPGRVVRYRFEPDVIAELMRLDYARLTDSALKRHESMLYDEITVDNVRFMVDALMGTINPAVNQPASCLQHADLAPLPVAASPV